MKLLKFLIVGSIALTSVLWQTPAWAQHHHHGYRAHPHRHVGSGYWIAPAVIGGIVGYALAQPRTVYTPPPVIYAPYPVVNMPPPPIGYHYENILDQNCNCYRVVLIPN